MAIQHSHFFSHYTSVTMPFSIEFSWHKDLSGYRLVKRGSLPDRNPPFDTIVPNGGERILTHPMEVPDTYRIFAHVVSAEDLLRFVQRFGLLGLCEIKRRKGVRRYRDPIDGSEAVKQYEYQGMPVRPYLKQAALFRDALRLKASADAESGGRAKWSRRHQGLDQLATFLESSLKMTFEDLRVPPILGDQSIMGYLHLVADRDLGARFQVTPLDLMQALWVQLGKALVSSKKLSTCRHCGELFEAGPRTERRADAKFCSDEHRILYNSLNRKPARRS